jgi:hypothetical protein
MAKPKSDSPRIPSWLTVLPPATGGPAPKSPPAGGDQSSPEESPMSSDTTASVAPVPVEPNLASK